MARRLLENTHFLQLLAVNDLPWDFQCLAIPWETPVSPYVQSGLGVRRAWCDVNPVLQVAILSGHVMAPAFQQKGKLAGVQGRKAVSLKYHGKGFSPCRVRPGQSLSSPF